jgi:hypothetical protein
VANLLKRRSLLPDFLGAGIPPLWKLQKELGPVKTRLIKWGIAASSLVMLVAATGAGRKF